MPLAAPTIELAPSGHAPAVILLVEDDDAIRELMTFALISHGYEVHACADSRNALEHAGRISPSPQLLISDVDLGQLSGPDMAVQMRVGFPAMKILFVSGYPGVIARASASTDSAATLRQADYLTKPFSIKQLYQHVEEILARDS